MTEYTVEYWKSYVKTLFPKLEKLFDPANSSFDDICYVIASQLKQTYDATSDITKIIDIDNCPSTLLQYLSNNLGEIDDITKKVGYNPITTVTSFNLYSIFKNIEAGVATTSEINSLRKYILFIIQRYLDRGTSFSLTRLLEVFNIYTKIQELWTDDWADKNNKDFIDYYNFCYSDIRDVISNYDNVASILDYEQAITTKETNNANLSLLYQKGSYNRVAFKNESLTQANKAGIILSPDIHKYASTETIIRFDDNKSKFSHIYRAVKDNSSLYTADRYYSVGFDFPSYNDLTATATPRTSIVKIDYDDTANYPVYLIMQETNLDSEYSTDIHYIFKSQLAPKYYSINGSYVYKDVLRYAITEYKPFNISSEPDYYDFTPYKLIYVDVVPSIDYLPEMKYVFDKNDVAIITSDTSKVYEILNDEWVESNDFGLSAGNISQLLTLGGSFVEKSYEGISIIDTKSVRLDTDNSLVNKVFIENNYVYDYAGSIIYSEITDSGKIGFRIYDGTVYIKKIDVDKKPETNILTTTEKQMSVEPKFVKDFTVTPNTYTSRVEDVSFSLASDTMQLIPASENAVVKNIVYDSNIDWTYDSITDEILSTTSTVAPTGYAVAVSNLIAIDEKMYDNYEISAQVKFSKYTTKVEQMFAFDFKIRTEWNDTLGSNALTTKLSAGLGIQNFDVALEGSLNTYDNTSFMAGYGDTNKQLIENNIWYTLKVQVASPYVTIYFNKSSETNPVPVIKYSIEYMTDSALDVYRYNNGIVSGAKLIGRFPYDLTSAETSEIAYNVNIVKNSGIPYYTNYGDNAKTTNTLGIRFFNEKTTIKNLVVNKINNTYIRKGTPIDSSLKVSEIEQIENNFPRGYAITRINNVLQTTGGLYLLEVEYSDNNKTIYYKKSDDEPYDKFKENITQIDVNDGKIVILKNNQIEIFDDYFEEFDGLYIYMNTAENRGNTLYPLQCPNRKLFNNYVNDNSFTINKFEIIEDKIIVEVS